VHVDALLGDGLDDKGPETLGAAIIVAAIVILGLVLTLGFMLLRSLR
jgi:hypothetical protein